MKIEPSLLHALARALEVERKRQKLSREQAASVCGVSASFIRDVEADPENCSLGKLARLISGLGLSLNVEGLLPVEALNKDPLKNLPKANGRPDFGVSDDQIVSPQSIRQPIGLDAVPLKAKGDPA